MKKYRGYYIDGVVFTSKAQIDEFCKNALIDKIKVLYDMMTSGRYTAEQMMKISEDIDWREERLHNEFGIDWDEIETLAF